MANLTLGPGPVLTWWDFDRQNTAGPSAMDVSQQATAFLFEPVALHPGLNMGDIFKLLDVCLPLKDVFRRSWAAQLCDEARKGAVDAGNAQLVSADDVFQVGDRPGFVALFETLADISRAEVSQAMRQLDDDEPAGPAFHRLFAGQVVVKKQFWDRPGREFRQAFRAAGR